HRMVDPDHLGVRPPSRPPSRGRQLPDQSRPTPRRAGPRPAHGGRDGKRRAQHQQALDRLMAGGDGGAWVLPAGMFTVTVVGGAVELGGAIASQATGSGWRFVPFTFASGVTLIRSGSHTLWPGID